MERSRLEQLLEMLAGSPGDRDLRYFVANEYYRMDRFSEALAHLEEYFRGGGEDEGMGHLMRGTCLARLGRKEEAKAALETGIDAALRHRHQDLAAEIEEALAAFFPAA